MLQIAICDDDPDCVSTIKNYISKYCSGHMEVNISTFSDGTSFLCDFKTDKYLIIFLDIELGDFNGLSIAEKIWESDKRAALVFVTGHEQYRVDAYEVHPFYYLLKPVTLEKIEKILDDYFSVLREKEKYFEYKQKKIIIDSICYIEKYKNKLFIVTHTDKMEIYSSLKDIISKLDHSFVQCHKGFIVNISKVISYDNSSINNECKLLGCEEKIPIGSKFKEMFEKKYSEYMKQHWRYLL